MGEQRKGLFGFRTRSDGTFNPHDVDHAQRGHDMKHKEVTSSDERRFASPLMIAVIGGVLVVLTGTAVVAS